MAATIVLGAATANAQHPGGVSSIDILTTETVSPVDDGWEITPVDVGFGGIPESALRLSFSQSLRHDPRNIIEVTVRAENETILLPIGHLAEGGAEIFATRTIAPGSEETTLRWALDDRLGDPGGITAVDLIVARESKANTNVESITVTDFFVADAAGLDDQALIDAMVYRPLNLKFHQVPRDNPEQEFVAVLPLEVASRHKDGKLVLRVNGRISAEASLEQNESPRRVFITRQELALEEPLEERNLAELFLVAFDGTETKLDEQAFLAVDSAQMHNTFEVPYQSIIDYVPYYLAPDLNLVTVVRDLYVKNENPAMRTANHDVLGHTVSLGSESYETQQVWRMTSYNNWAAGGFHSIGIGRIPDSDIFGFYITGTDPDGLETLGLATTAGKSMIRPTVTNPVYYPNEEAIGWEPGMKRTVRGNAFARYGRSHILLNAAQADQKQPIIVASLSPDLRTFADAGLPSLPTEAATRHLHLTRNGAYYYLLTDHPNAIWISRDPLREWEKQTVEFPRELSAFRIGQLDDEHYLFGIINIEGRNIITYIPIEWSKADIPLPIVNNN